MIDSAALKALKCLRLSKRKISLLELTGLILDGEGDFRNTLFAEKLLKDVLTRILGIFKNQDYSGLGSPMVLLSLIPERDDI